MQGLKNVRFDDRAAAMRHLSNHVLTPPESHGWQLVWNGRFPSLSPDAESLKWCAMQRDSLASALAKSASAEQATTSPDVEELLGSYVDTIKSHLQTARRLGWTVNRKDRSANFDISGIFSATDDRSGDTVVRTAFLPGFGAAEATKQSHATPTDPHARTRGISKMRGHHRDQRHRVRGNGVCERMANRRANGWSPEQKHFYLIFRPAVQFIRAWQPGIDHTPRPNMQDLKPVLPRMSEMKFERWQSLKQEVSQ